jgi:hypothetical protein
VGEHSHVFSGQKSLHTQSSVRRRIVMMKQPVLVPLSFQTFSADLLPQTFPNLQIVMLVHRLAWRNKFLVKNTLTVKKGHQHALVRPTFESREPLRSLPSPMSLSSKAVLRISCVSGAICPSLKQNLTQIAFHL